MSILNKVIADSTSQMAYGINLGDSKIQVPVEIQSIITETIQTHNAEPINAGSYLDSPWLDCSDADKLGLTLKNDAATASKIALQWSNDGAIVHGSEEIMAGSNQEKTAIAETKAEYYRVRVYNDDTASHTMSAWSLKKA